MLIIEAIIYINAYHPDGSRQWSKKTMERNIIFTLMLQVVGAGSLEDNTVTVNLFLLNIYTYVRSNSRRARPLYQLYNS